MKYKYKISVVTAVYNVEEYLRECIESVINQTIGFEENVQLILVNDGSPDKSEEICIEYANQFPNNIVYIKKDNGGVSSARNEGMKYVQGKYMNFLDSDDTIDLRVMERVYNFFEEIYEHCDIVSIPINFFEAKSGAHILNYKYAKTRLINMLKEYKNPQLSASSTFVKSEFKDKFKFNVDMKYAEDAEFVNKIILEKGTMGVVAGVGYNYRYRANETSAIQLSTKRKEWYMDYLKYFSKELIDYCNQTKGYVPLFIQYLIMYDLQWRFRQSNLDPSVLNDEEAEAYKKCLRSIIQQINPKVIIEQKNMSIHHKLHILKMGFRENEEECINTITTPQNIELMLKDDAVCHIYQEKLIIEILDISNGHLIIEGRVGKLIQDEVYEIILEINDEKRIIAEKIDREIYNQFSLGDVIKEYQGFRVNINLKDIKMLACLKLYIRIGETVFRPHLQLSKFIRINQHLPKSYFEEEGFIIVFMYNAFNILPSTLKIKVGREYHLTKELIKKKEYKTIAIRLIYFLMKAVYKKPIWLFMDRVDKADDNAEHLFKYAQAQDEKIKKYFVIKKECSDFERMKQYGKVVEYNSYYHKFLLLLATHVVSSHIEDSIRVPFKGKGKYLRDLADFKFIFLQHGIIKDDLSTWLNKANKKIDLFVTSSNLEYKSILEGKYGYDKDVVKLTGLPRYDKLVDKSSRQILIMPTWRKDTVCELNQNTGERPYNARFKESNYFNTYNNLINDKNLLGFIKRAGYKIVFCPHPCIHQQMKDFEINSEVKIADYNESYQTLFNTSSILITDYSSVAFDFAYMKKPVLYYQFDRDTFFEGHTYDEGYFDYETMGFGKVCYEKETLVEQIKLLINNEAKMEEEYSNRVNDFYKYTDQNNCERVYREIINMTNE